jgi:YVTN family beta-propeller protein
MSKHTLLAAATLAWTVAHAAAAIAAEPAARIYVSNEDDGDVAVIDAGTEEVTAHIKVGKRPRGIKLSPDGKLLYVALSGSPRGGPGVDESKLPPPDRKADGIGVVDLASGKVLRTIKSGQDPESFALSADGKRLFVSNEETAEMSVVDLGANKVIKRVPVGKEPEGVTLRPDGKAVYVTCEENNEIVAIDTKSWKVLAHIETGPRPRSITFTLDGARAFVATENAASLTLIDAVANKATGSLAIVSKSGKVIPPRPMGAVLSPDGKTLYVSNGRGGSIAVIDVAKAELVRMIEDVGPRPWGIGVSADGSKLYTANGPSNDVSVIDVATGKVTKRIKAGGLPWGLVVSR